MSENTGHGHVFPRPDGVKARCGGPGFCKECSRDAARVNWPPRFHLGNEKDTLRLLFTMVRDGVCSVDQAMDCIKLD